MPNRYPEVYPDLFADIDAPTTRLILQFIGSTHDGSLRPREEVADAVERGKQMVQRMEKRRIAAQVPPAGTDEQIQPA